MAELAIFHPDLGKHGGAESVCVRILEAIQMTDHDPTLVTFAEPDFTSLNEYYDATVDPGQFDIEVALRGVLGRAPMAARNNLRLLTALYTTRVADWRSYDAVVFTKGEFPCSVTSLQYVHYPTFFRERLEGYNPEGHRFVGAHERLLRTIGGVYRGAINGDNHAFIANSDWTGRQFESIYGFAPKTVYPPVNCEAFNPQPWEEREDGFVTVGAIDGAKQVLRNVEIVERVRDRGHDVHLHLIGGKFDSDYYKRIEAAANQRSWLHLEGQIHRSELTRLLSTHKYGLHGKEYEHFGVVVAEYLAAEAVPFVHDSGGQREIVGRANPLLYENADEAVEKICVLLAEPAKCEEIKSKLPDVASKFGQYRFRDEILTSLDRIIQQSS